MHFIWELGNERKNSHIISRTQIKQNLIKRVKNTIKNEKDFGLKPKHTFFGNAYQKCSAVHMRGVGKHIFGKKFVINIILFFPLSWQTGETDYVFKPKAKKRSRF